MEDQKVKKHSTSSQVQKAIIAIAETEAGVIYFRALMQRCYYQKSTVTGSPESGEINIYGTLFNEAQRRLYLDVRREIPKNILKKIENT